MTCLVGGLTVGSLTSQSPETVPLPATVNTIPDIAALDTPHAGQRSDAIPFLRDPNRWSYQFGVGFITRSQIGDLTTGQVALARGEAEGQIYLLQALFRLSSFEPRFFGTQAGLDLELPLVLGLVDERGSSLFPQYSAGLLVRWRTFPWSRWVDTTFETAVGLTYSHQVLAIERSRHPDRDRSHLELYWPIQFTLAHPQHRQHQLVLFNHHHSGGRIFHKGGANSLGIGYRFVFGNR